MINYNRNRNFKTILNEIHNDIINKVQSENLQKNAQILQSILSKIKITAYLLNEAKKNDKSVICDEAYKQLIETVSTVQNRYHNNKLGIYTLFHRGHHTSIGEGLDADDIFEEEIATVLAVLENQAGNINVDPNSFLFGTKAMTTEDVKDLPKKIEKDALKILKKLAENEQKKIPQQITGNTGKIDISGKAINLNYSIDIPDFQLLRSLMADATFSLKNYTTHSYDLDKKIDLQELQLHLGNTNLYKSITGALNETGLSKEDRSAIFFRGMNHILIPKAYPEQTRKDFFHLRFIYELRGSGLLDDFGEILPVKYMIYNDPSSNNIFVRDTASIIQEALNRTKGSSLFSGISISAYDINSNK